MSKAKETLEFVFLIVIFSLLLAGSLISLAFVVDAIERVGAIFP